MRVDIVFGIVCSMLISGWTIQKPSKIKEAEWLIGTWENKTKRGSIYESWEKRGIDELVGKSFMLEEGDTIILETIRLVEVKKDLFFIPTVRDQNDQKPVRFRAVSFSATVMKFENKEHDFPQAIEYQKIHADSLVAAISGIKDGQMGGLQFPMKRLKK